MPKHHKNKVTFSLRQFYLTNHNYVKISASDRSGLTPFVNNFFRSRVTQVSVEDLSLKYVVQHHGSHRCWEELCEYWRALFVYAFLTSLKKKFIEMATGITGIVGHSLESKTNEISVFKLSCPGITDSDIYFVDTPGFDDTNKSDV